MSNFYERVARELVEASPAVATRSARACLPSSNCATQFGASRNTVRAALRELQDLGLIAGARRPARAWTSAQPTSGYRHSFDSVDELVQFGARHKREVARSIEEAVADRALAKKLGCPVGKAWLRISSLRLDADRRAVGWTDVYRRSGVRRHRRPRARASGDAHQHAHRVALRTQHRGDPAGNPRHADSGRLAAALATKAGARGPRGHAASTTTRRATLSRCRSACIPPIALSS